MPAHRFRQFWESEAHTALSGQPLEAGLHSHPRKASSACYPMLLLLKSSQPYLVSLPFDRLAAVYSRDIVRLPAAAMAEASTVGLAAGILQFLDFGSRLSISFYSFYQAGRLQHGRIPNARAFVEELQRIILTLHKSINADGTTAEEFAPMLQTCQSLAAEMESKLNRLACSRSPTALKALQAAWRSIWHEDEIGRLQDRLEKLHAPLMLALISAQRYEHIKFSTILSRSGDSIDENLVNNRSMPIRNSSKPTKRLSPSWTR